MNTSYPQQRAHHIHLILHNMPVHASKATKGVSDDSFKMKPSFELNNNSWRGKEDSVETAATPRKGPAQNHTNSDLYQSSLNNAHI